MPNQDGLAEKSSAPKKWPGCTALAALIIGSQVWIANAGQLFPCTQLMSIHVSMIPFINASHLSMHLQPLPFCQYIAVTQVCHLSGIFGRLGLHLVFLLQALHEDVLCRRCSSRHVQRRQSSSAEQGAFYWPGLGERARPSCRRRAARGIGCLANRPGWVAGH